MKIIKFLWSFYGKFQVFVTGSLLVTISALGLGIIIGHFAINNTNSLSSKFNRLTRPADPKVYRTFIDSIQAANIEADLK